MVSNYNKEFWSELVEHDVCYNVPSSTHTLAGIKVILLSK